LPGIESPQKEEEPNPIADDINVCIDEYMRLDLDISQILFSHYNNVKSRNGPKGERRHSTQQPNRDLEQRVSKLTLPTFDHSGKVIARA